MARGIRVGVGGVKICKKVWVGVGGVPRRVKKIFAGIGGAIKLVFSGEPSKLELDVKLSMPRGYISLAASNTGNNYILIGGGYTGYQSYTDTVDAFDVSLVRTNAPVLHQEDYNFSAASIGNYVIFAGGGARAMSANATAYNNDLVKSNPSSLQRARNYLAPLTFANYAWFLGGIQGGGHNRILVDLYNSSLVSSKQEYQDWYVGIGKRGAALTHSHAIFAGGENYSGTKYDGIHAFSSSLVHTSLSTKLNSAKTELAGASVGEYAIFAGGSSTEVEAINNSLVKLDLTPLSFNLQRLGACSTSEYAVFAGGMASPYNANKTVYTYDDNLVQGTLEDLETPGRHGMAAGKIGNYIIFGGGLEYTSLGTSRVLDNIEIYEI